MTRLSTVFISSIAFLILLFLMTMQHAHRQDEVRMANIKRVVKITRLPGMAHSSAYLEARFPAYADYSNTVYPKMRQVGYMGFVYDK